MTSNCYALATAVKELAEELPNAIKVAHYVILLVGFVFFRGRPYYSMKYIIPQM